jgi:hypothetical protein
MVSLQMHYWLGIALKDEVVRAFVQQSGCSCIYANELFGYIDSLVVCWLSVSTYCVCSTAAARLYFQADEENYFKNGFI